MLQEPGVNSLLSAVLMGKTHERGNIWCGFCSIEGSVSPEAEKTMIAGARNIRHKAVEKGRTKLFWGRNKTGLVMLEVRCLFFFFWKHHKIKPAYISEHTFKNLYYSR